VRHFSSGRIPTYAGSVVVDGGVHMVVADSVVPAIRVPPSARRILFRIDVAQSPECCCWQWSTVDQAL
jgi:hypothetical protein